jgi:hypothetical protein
MDPTFGQVSKSDVYLWCGIQSGYGLHLFSDGKYRGSADRPGKGSLVLRAVTSHQRADFHSESCEHKVVVIGLFRKALSQAGRRSLRSANQSRTPDE